jgi:tetratricopeptide (TPR) repeat protein
MPSLYVFYVCRYEQTCGNIAGSLDLLATTIAKNDSFYPAHIESSKIYITRRQYRLSRDSAKRALTIAQDNIEALQLIVLLHHIASCDKSEYISNLKQLVHLLVSAKNTSMKACFQNAQLLSRLCGNHDKVTLEFALSLISKAHALNRIDVSVRLEKAKILQRLGRYQKAIAEYQLISTLNESSIEASRGIVLCQALNGNFSDARDQLAFITLVEEEESRYVPKFDYIFIMSSIMRPFSLF